MVSMCSLSYSQVIDSRQYNYVGNWYNWQGGRFTTNLNIPKVTATTGRDSGALRYSISDSSIYVWTGSQWRQVGSGGAGSGTVTQVTSGNLTDFFTTSVANATTTPALSFTIANTSQYRVWGRSASGTGTPSYILLDTTFISDFAGKVRSLFTATNGLTYSNGQVKLGGSLTEDTWIYGQNNTYGIFADSLRILNILARGSLGNYSLILNPDDTKIEITAAQPSVAGSSFFVFPDSIQFSPHLGRIFIDTIANSFVDTSLRKPITYNVSTRRMEYLEGWPSGGTTNVDSAASRISRGTFDQRPASPDTGQLFWQTDRLRGDYSYDGDRWQFNGSVLNYIYYNSFNGSGSLTKGYNVEISSIANGAGSTVSIIALSGLDGVLDLRTGTTTGGYANTNFIGINSSTATNYDSIIVWTEYYVYIPTLSDGTDTYTLCIGASTSTTSYGFPAFAFKYSHGVNSGEWETITRAHNSGSLTTKDTNVPVVAGSWVKMNIELDGYAKTIKFYINDVLVTTHTTSDNILYNGAITWGNVGYGHAGIIKSAGTNTRSLYVDYLFAYITKRKYP